MADKHQYFNGKMFTRDENTGYYLCSSKSADGSRNRMHVYVWEYYNGSVPDGYHVHHKDEDKSNNDISNLELKIGVEHLAFHAKENAERNRDRVIQNLNENASPKAKEWHGSAEGREWHKSHYEKMKSKLYRKQKFQCIVCGKGFESTQVNAKFCSNNCKSKHRRTEGIDNIETECVVCGKKFVKNRYSKKETCSRECGTKLLVYRRNKIHW